MTRREEERNLEQALAFGCEPGVLPAVRTRATTAKRAATKKSEGMVGEPSMKAKSKRTATEPKPKKTSRTTGKVGSIGKAQVVQMKNLVPKTSPEQVTVVDKVVSGMAVELQGPLAPLETNSLTGVSAHPSIGSNVLREMCFEPVIIVPESGREESAQRSLAEKEIEVAANRIQLVSDTGTRGVAILNWLAGAWKWTLKHIGSHHTRKRLRVCESVSLGEKRFVAVIEVDGEQFLVGGASSSVATLARLEPSQEFAAVLKRRWAQEPVQA